MQERKKQEKDYSFLRQLTTQISEEEQKQICIVLKENGMELYQKEGEEFSLITDDGDHTEKVTDGCLYISAADREAAVKYLQEAGLGSNISDSQMIPKSKNLVEEAEEEYMKRRRMRMIECLVVLVLAILYYLYKSFSL